MGRQRAHPDAHIRIARRARQMGITKAELVRRILHEWDSNEEKQAALALELKNPGLPFDEFWKLFPRKVGKFAAADIWRDLSADDQRRALSSLRDHLLLWQDRDPKYIPHPTTWLNRRSFEDDVQSELPYAQRYRGMFFADAIVEVTWNLWCVNCLQHFKHDPPYNLLMTTPIVGGQWDGTDTHRCIDGTVCRVSIEQFDPTFGIGPYWHPGEQRVGRRYGAWRIALQSGRSSLPQRLLDVRGEDEVRRMLSDEHATR